MIDKTIFIIPFMQIIMLKQKNIISTGFNKDLELTKIIIIKLINKCRIIIAAWEISCVDIVFANNGGSLFSEIKLLIFIYLLPSKINITIIKNNNEEFNNIFFKSYSI